MPGFDKKCVFPVSAYLFPSLTALIFIQICFLFLPFISGRSVVFNDYVNIPEETLLGGVYTGNQRIMSMANAGEDLSGAKKEFFLKNSHELSFQAQCGWFMHHHFALLSAVNQFSGGRRIDEINQQYGMLVTVMLSAVLKMSGGVTLDGYLRVLYSFFPFYYLIVFLAALYIFRDFKYVFLVALFSALMLLKLSYTSINLAPGFNPVRQLFLPVILVFLWLFLKSGRPLTLLLTAAFSLINVLNNKEFGLCAVIALLITLAVKSFLEGGSRKVWILGVLSLTLFLAFLLIFRMQAGNNSLSKYYMAGISGPLIGRKVLTAIFLWISAAYFLIIRLLRVKGELKYLAVFLFIYFQGILVYFIWNPAPNHFYSIAVPLIFLAAALLKLIMDNSRIDKYRDAVFYFITLIIIAFFYLPAWRAYRADYANYKKTADNHRIYKWDLQKARIYSTMDPRPFSDAVRLINKYSPAAKSIYIISQYDNLLALLADKYSAMPFDEVAISLVTVKEVEACARRIAADNPEYIFVDTGIGEGIYEKSNPAVAYLAGQFDLSAKLKMWGELKKVYLEVINSYELAEKSDIISVYKKKRL